MVSNVTGDKIEVIMSRTAACGDCSSCGGGCEVETINLDVDNNINAQIGDFVQIQYKSANMIKTTALLYIFPLIMMVLGIYFGSKVSLNIPKDLQDLASFGFGLVTLAVSFLIVHLIDKRFKVNNLISIKKISWLGVNYGKP